LWNHISLPYSNPYGIVGPLSLLGFNPLNNLLRFLVLIALPVFLLILTALLPFSKKLFEEKKEEPDSTPERNVWEHYILGFLLLFYIVSILPQNIPYRKEITPLDTFHEGETLGSATEVLHGKTPFKETIFIHGLFQDPLRSLLAFKLFGRSIASERALDSILHIITFFLFFFTLFLLFRKDILATFWAVLIMHIPVYFFPASLQLGPFPFFFPPRDLIPLVYVILSLVYAYRVQRDGLLLPHMGLLNYLLSFFAILSLIYANDRGYFVLATSIIFLVLHMLILSRSGSERLVTLLSYFAGYLTGFLLLGFLIKWAYKDFFAYVFWILPRTNGFMNEYVYPIFKTFRGMPVYLAPLVVVSINLFWWVYKLLARLRRKGRVREKIRHFLNQYYRETLLVFLSLFYFKGALGRSSLGHIYNYAGFSIVLLTFIFLRHYFLPFSFRKWKKSFLLGSFLIMLFVFLPTSLLRFTKNVRNGAFSLPLGISDSLFIPDNYRASIAFLKSNLGDDEFVTLTSEGSWYYFLDKACPTRFPVVFLASPTFYQEEFVEEMERKKVKYVLYRNDCIYNRIDGIPNEVRLPIIFNYVKSHYRFFRKIDDQELWIRIEKARRREGH